MNTKEIVLAALSCGNRALYTPVQIQKLFFLIDRNISSKIGGPFFDFQPYNYGPYDKQIYNILEELCIDGLIHIVPNARWKEYQLSQKGQSQGEQLFLALDKNIREYILALSKFVRSVSFTQLISAIYKAYPDMKVNSVFKEQ